MTKIMLILLDCAFLNAAFYEALKWIWYQLPEDFCIVSAPGYQLSLLCHGNSSLKISHTQVKETFADSIVM